MLDWVVVPVINEPVDSEERRTDGRLEELSSHGIGDLRSDLLRHAAYLGACTSK